MESGSVLSDSRLAEASGDAQQHLPQSDQEFGEAAGGSILSTTEPQSAVLRIQDDHSYIKEVEQSLRMGHSLRGELQRTALGCGRLDRSQRDNSGAESIQAGDGMRRWRYHSSDPTIAAVGPGRYVEWPCGTRLRVCTQIPSVPQPQLPIEGRNLPMPEMRCLVVSRQDSCPGCSDYTVDLSESGLGQSVQEQEVVRSPSKRNPDGSLRI